MEILIRSARIIDTGSSYHNQVKDLLIAGGKIKKIGSKLQNTTKAKELKYDNLHVSLGWFDLNTFLADPGHEQKETIESGCKAAAFGGYTHICAMPGTTPVIQSKGMIDYVLKKSQNEVVSVHPIGALTLNTEGKELADMYDMYNAGAVAFSDGLKPSPNAGLVERALLYVKAFGGLIMNHAEDKSISKNGAMNEGLTSTKLGLPPAPALAEEVAINRDLYLLEYTGSKLHFLDVSLKRSVELIKAAKKKGLKVTASVNAYNLALDESAVGNYDTNAKLNPHLRSKDDVLALQKAVAEGVIDTITSAHNPQDEECKKLEFDKADFGAIGLETTFAVANTKLNKAVGIDKLVEIFAANPRKVLGMEVPAIDAGADADLTLFNPNEKWVFEEKHIQSRSKNTPFIGAEFTGRAIGVINKNKVHLNY